MTNCIFPAAAILEQMRQIAREADSLMPTHPEAALTRLRAYRELEVLRLDHEAQTGCQCWFEAVEATGGQVHA
jgi:hypothetical protein